METLGTRLSAVIITAERMRRAIWRLHLSDRDVTHCVAADAAVEALRKLALDGSSPGAMIAMDEVEQHLERLDELLCRSAVRAAQRCSRIADGFALMEEWSDLCGSAQAAAELSRALRCAADRGR